MATRPRPSAASTALADAERSLDTYSSAFGAFPYPEMDVVLAGFTTFGGMEYPTIIFTNPDRFTVCHELGHQYWYGIVGDNQFAEPWLDESFASGRSYLPFGRVEAVPVVHWPSASPRCHHERHGLLERASGLVLV